MLSHITKTHDLKNFKYDGLKGFWAFDYMLLNKKNLV